MEDPYVISLDASELTVCVSPPLPCTSSVEVAGEFPNVKCTASVMSYNGTALGEIVFCYSRVFIQEFRLSIINYNIEYKLKVIDR